MTRGEKKHNKIRYPFPALRCMGSVITHLAVTLSVLLVSSATHLNNDSLGALVCFITSYMGINFFLFFTSYTHNI